MNAEQAIAIGKLVLAFGRKERATLHEDGIRHETDTDHTVMLGIIACEACPDWLSRGRVAEFALVHDLVEARAGDTNTFGISPEDRAAKEGRERIAMASIRDEFGADSWMVSTMEAYERQEEEEAEFVRFLDKAMPKITHLLNSCAAIKALGFSREQLEEEHRLQFESLMEKYPGMDPSVSSLLRELMALSVRAYDGS